MSLILASLALGLLSAWRGSLLGVLLGAWALAGIMSAGILFGVIDLTGLLPVVALALLGYNGGVGLGFALNYARGHRVSAD